VKYLGGKKRLAKRIAAVLEAHRLDGQPFKDVACGSLAVSSEMSDRGPRFASDGCEPLISLYSAWRMGWRPPVVTEELYVEAKAKQDPADPLTAFLGFGCSYGGKWFGGYARGWVLPGTQHDQSRSKGGTERADYSAVATRSLDKILSRCAEVQLSCLFFNDVDVSSGDLVYADPEYRGTTRYNYFRQFNYEDFLRCIDRWRERGAEVFVSEYAAQQPNWQQVAEWTCSKNIARAPRTERLFRVG
jgi:DNA adenine methylase